MATQDDIDKIDQQIQDHKDYLNRLQQLSDQVTRTQPTGYYSFGRGLAQFNKDRQAKLLEIERQSKRSQQDFRDLQHSRQRTAMAVPGAKQAAPLSEAGQLTELERQRKQGQDIVDQGPEKRKAESQIEQQKAADTTSKVALGASIPTKTGGAQPQSLADLMTKFQMRPDRATGEYVFSRPNEEGNLTPGQTRAGTQLAAALKPSGLQPEQVFGAGVPAPVFDPKTGISNGVGNPFVGKKSDYDALAGLYQQAQPSPNTELRVPTGTLDRAYQATAPAYGPTFPANPVDIDRKTPAAVALAGMGKPGDEGYIPRAPEMATREALMQGKAAGDVASFDQPIGLNLTSANPITRIDTGGAPQPISLPVNADANTPVAPDPAQTTAAGAQRLADLAKVSPNAATILKNAQAQGLPQTDPSIQEALAQDSSEARAQLYGKAAMAGVGSINPTGIVTGTGSILMQAIDAERKARQDKLDAIAKAQQLRGLPAGDITDEDLASYPSVE